MTDVEVIALVVGVVLMVFAFGYKLGETDGYVKGFRRAREILEGDYEDEYFNDGF